MLKISTPMMDPNGLMRQDGSIDLKTKEYPYNMQMHCY